MNKKKYCLEKNGFEIFFCIMPLQLMAAVVPLALIDALICWWTFSSLVTTTRALRLRRNTTKLSLYKHFTNVLALAIVASVALMIWTLKSVPVFEALRFC